MQSLMETFGVENELFPQVCVCVDKLGKITDEAICSELVELGLAQDTSEKIVKIIAYD